MAGRNAADETQALESFLSRIVDSFAALNQRVDELQQTVNEIRPFIEALQQQAPAPPLPASWGATAAETPDVEQTWTEHTLPLSRRVELLLAARGPLRRDEICAALGIMPKAARDALGVARVRYIETTRQWELSTPAKPQPTQ